MKARLFNSVRQAFPRFLLGLVGIWCSLGPIVLSNASRSASPEVRTVFFLLLLVCYAVVIVFCLRSRWDALKGLLWETMLAMCFMIIGLLINELTGIFIAFKDKLVIVYAFVGFFMAELIKPKLSIKALDKFRRKQTAYPIRPATEGERSEEASSVGLTTQNELAKEVASLSSRLAESQRTLAEHEKEQRRLVNTQAENQQLQERINTLRNQLQASENALKQSTVRIQQAVDLGATLQSETAALKEQLGEREDTIEALQSAAQRATNSQYESQELSFENQRLQEELKNHRMQLNASETQLQELTRANQELSDCYERLKTEVADLNLRLKDSQSHVREIESARQQLADVESRETMFSEQQHQLESRIADLERDLSEARNQVQALDDTRQRLRETERVCQELAEENRRFTEAVSVWQERLAASEETQRQVSLLRQQVHELQTEHAQLINERRQTREEFTASGEPTALSHPVTDFNHPTATEAAATAGAELSLGRAKVHERIPPAIAISESKSLISASPETAGGQAHFGSGDLIAGFRLEKLVKASWFIWTSIKGQFQFGAIAATVVVIAGALATAVLGTKFSAPKEAAVAPDSSFQEYSAPKEVAVAPETSSQENKVEAVVSKPQKKPPSRLRGTFKTVRPTQVYSGPTENSALIADIGVGMKVNVVDSNFGWLEIRSRHGRPPGFIRQEAAVIVRN